MLLPAAPARAPLESALGVARRSIEGARASVLSLRAGTGSTRGDLYFAGEVEEELFRIAAEALMNVRKHAGAREVHLELAREGETAVLTVRDDGAGFAAEHAAANRWRARV